MLELNLPQVEFRIKRAKNGFLIFDRFRRKYIQLTPEEWVRQNFLRFLIDHKGFPEGRIAVEKELLINQMPKRCDAIVYNQRAEAQILIELKAPDIALTQAVFDQVAVYNTKLDLSYFIVSNGMQHYFCRIEKASSNYQFFDEIPHYNTLE